MNATVAQQSIPTLLRLLTIALALAVWNVTKAIIRFSLHYGDILLRAVGAATIFAYKVLVACLLFLHKHLTSMNAMRRYKRWILAAYHWVDHTTTIFGEWAMNKFVLRGKLGEVSFNVEGAFDGYIVVREYGDERNANINFWCENRWAMRKGMTGRQIGELRTKAILVGLNFTRFVMAGKISTCYAPMPEVVLPEVMTWKPATALPDHREWTANDILLRVA